MIRGTPGTRLAFAILSPIFLFLWLITIHGEDQRPWANYQEEFAKLYVARATAKLQEAEGKNDPNERTRWQRVVNEVSNRRPEITQVYLEDLKVADRCMSCHQGIDNPLFADAPQPYRSHPGDLLKSHEVNSFGCTRCHQGDGAATTVEDAHARKADAAAPLLPTAYVQTTCVSCHEVTHGYWGAEIVTRGADLFLDKGCYGCHSVSGMSYLPKFATPLNAIKTKLKDPANWIYSWIKDPRKLTPHTLMPSFKLSDEEAGKITAFLLSLSEKKSLEPVNLEGASPEEGEKLFQERGCRACHGTKPDEVGAGEGVPHLSGIGSKVSAEWLDRWIADPKADNPDTAMPKVELKDDERRAIVAYLLTLKRSEALPPAPDLGRFTAEQGKQLVKDYECYGCHAIKGFEQTRPSVPDLAEFSHKRADELDFGNVKDVPRFTWSWLERKLKDPRAYETKKIKLRMPVMSMSDEEARALIAYSLTFGNGTLPARYLVRATAPKRALREVSWMVLRLHCNGCHRVNEKDAHMAKFVERRNMLPPTLDGIGARLQGQYMYQFLHEPKAVRPWLTLRMPTYPLSDPQMQLLVDGFAAAAAVTNPYTYVAQTHIAQDHFQRGIKRFNHYKCVQCHPTSIDQGLPPDVDPEDLAINLMLTKSRLRPEWIKDFMARPKQIAGSETRMPTVFYTVEGTPKVEKPKEDIDDITTYLMGMTEPPEVTLKAQEEQKKAEEEKVVDWSKVEY